MFDPVTNQILNHAARKAAVERRPREQRARQAEEGSRPGEFGDVFEHTVGGIEAASPVRRLADADQEDAREDRLAGEGSRGRTSPGGGDERGLDLTA